MNTRYIIVCLLVLLALGVSSRQAVAVTAPSFPSCTNPQGTLRVSYDSGVHGIPGDLGEYSGSDKVYDVSSETLMQCFCSQDTAGIQTNWWKVSSLSQDEIQTLKNLGWILIPNGALWGLDEAPYMAKNEVFACKSAGGTSLTQAEAPVCSATPPAAPRILSVVKNGSEATITWTKSAPATHYVLAYGDTPGNYIYGVPNTGNVTTYTVAALDPNKQYYFKVIAVNDCMPSVESSLGGGRVLGLAMTGNAGIILTLSGGGILLTALGIALARNEKNSA